MAGNWINDSLKNVCNRIARIKGVLVSEVTDIGSIRVVLEGMNRDLRIDILDIGKRSMLPVHVFYQMPDGNIIGESKPKTEWVQDYYKTLDVPGFAMQTSTAPPEEVAAEPKGALKLRRVRSATRGRPVVAWRLGDSEIRAGATLKFSKEAALQGSMGKTITVRNGAKATVNELSSRRPIAFVTIGDFNGIELPIHMMGSFYDVDKAIKKESIDEAKKAKSKSKLTPEFAKIMLAVGMGDPGNSPLGFGRAPGADNTPSDQPFDKDSWMVNRGAGGSADLDDDINTKEYEEVVESEDLEL